MLKCSCFTGGWQWCNSSNPIFRGLEAAAWGGGCFGRTTLGWPDASHYQPGRPATRDQGRGRSCGRLHHHNGGGGIGHPRPQCSVRRSQTEGWRRDHAPEGSARRRSPRFCNRIPSSHGGKWECQLTKVAKSTLCIKYLKGVTSNASCGMRSKYILIFFFAIIRCHGIITSNYTDIINAQLFEKSIARATVKCRGFLSCQSLSNWRFLVLHNKYCI